MKSETNQADTVFLVYGRFIKKHSKNEMQQIETWLKARMKTSKVVLLID